MIVAVDFDGTIVEGAFPGLDLDKNVFPSHGIKEMAQ